MSVKGADGAVWRATRKVHVVVSAAVQHCGGDPCGSWTLLLVLGPLTQTKAVVKRAQYIWDQCTGEVALSKALLQRVLPQRPKLTEKLLSRPPYRFIHDIITSVNVGSALCLLARPVSPKETALQHAHKFTIFKPVCSMRVQVRECSSKTGDSCWRDREHQGAWSCCYTRVRWGESDFHSFLCGERRRGEGNGRVVQRMSNSPFSISS